MVTATYKVEVDWAGNGNFGNELSNGDFESGLSSWTEETDPDVTGTTSQTTSESAEDLGSAGSLEIDVTASTGQGQLARSQTVTASAGETWTFIAWCKGDSFDTSVTARLQIRWLDSGDNQLGSDVIETTTDTSGDFIRLAAESETAPANTAKVKVQLNITILQSGDTGKAWFDVVTAVKDSDTSDITGDVLQMEWFMGRDFPSMLTGSSRGGRAIITLDNDTTDGKYSSFNTSSPLSGNILPSREVRISATYESGGNTLGAVMWAGFLDRINPQVSVNDVNTALLEAVGPLRYLARADFELFLALSSDQKSGAVIGDLLDAVSWPSADRGIDTGRSTIRRYYFMSSGVLGTRNRKVNWLNAAHKIEETENGFLHESKDGKVIFEDRDRRLGGEVQGGTGDRSVNAQVTASDSPAAGEISYNRITQGDPLKQIFNLFTTTIQNYTVGSTQVIWTHSEATAGGDAIPSIRSGDTYSVVALPPPDVAFDLVDNWTTPQATTDYVANSASDGTGSDLTGNISVSVTKLGQSMQIDLTNNASVTAFLTKLQARGQPLNLDDPVLVLAQDTTSQNKFGLRQYPVPAALVRDTQEGKNHVHWLLRIYKDPRPQLDILIQANKDTTHMSHVLRRAVSDKINITANSARTDLGINTGFFIESMHHKVNNKFDHTVLWSCSSISTTSPWFILGTNELGTTTALHY